MVRLHRAELGTVKSSVQGGLGDGVQILAFATGKIELEGAQHVGAGKGTILPVAADETGSQRQKFMGVPPSGQTIRVEGMNFYRLKGGRLTDIWTQFDALGMLQQIGAIPA